MADFCKQCSIDLFGKDYGDLSGLCTKFDNVKGLYACVTCEGCGPNQVDWEGRCISHCYNKHDECKEECKEQKPPTELNFTEEDTLPLF